MGNSFEISHVNTIQQLAKAASTVEELVQSFHSITDEEIGHIEQITVGQAENEIWHIQRKARITASNYHLVSTKVETLLKSERENVDTDSLRDRLLEKKGLNENIPSLKYGRNMEPI